MEEEAVGPFRLVGSGAARPAAVRAAALWSFVLAGVSGAALVAWSGHWWLFAVGALAILAAWFYTGGRNPYGYRRGVWRQCAVAKARGLPTED